MPFFDSFKKFNDVKPKDKSVIDLSYNNLTKEERILLLKDIYNLSHGSKKKRRKK